MQIPTEPDRFSLPLTPERMRWQIEIIGWDKQELVRRLGVKPSKVTAWLMGKSFVPDNVAVWLERLALTVKQMPVPEGWGYDPEVARGKHQQGNGT